MTQRAAREPTRGGMTYSEKLAARVRAVLKSQGHHVEEKKMMGGLAFMANGVMKCSVGKDGLLIRVTPSDREKALARPHVTPMKLGKRTMAGFVRVDGAGLRTESALRQWLTAGRQQQYLEALERMSQVERLKFTVEQIFGKGNLDVVAEAFAKNYRVHYSGKVYQGHTSVARWIKQLRTAIPDIRIAEIGFLLEKGNTITWQRSFVGTHNKMLRGIGATHKKIRWSEMVVTRFSERKIVEEWVLSELAGVLLSKSR